MADPVNDTPQPGTPEYDAAMAAKFEAGTGNIPPASTDVPGDADNDPNPADRPAWLPEKFKTPEDMAKAYAELEAKQSGKKDEAPPVDPQDEEGARQAVADAGLNFEELQADFETNGGQLSEDAYAKLESKGITRDLVDSYIQGQMAIVEGLRNTAFEAAGSQQQYETMTQWAQANMSPAEIAAYNSVVEGNDKDQIKFAVAGLKARYEAVNGTDPKLVGGSQAGATGGDVYESWAQVKADMKDPKYAKDPAFRAKVESKLGRSNPI